MSVSNLKKQKNQASFGSKWSKIKPILKSAIKATFVKLNPWFQLKNPVMFIVYLSAIFTTILFGLSFSTGLIVSQPWYVGTIALILWFTVLFANFAEAIAEGRGKAQADSLKKAKKNVMAKRIKEINYESPYEEINSQLLNIGDLVLIKAGDQVPTDGEAVLGIASVDESAITGESAPVIREAGGDRNAITGGTTVISDWIIIKVTAKPGETFLDKMIAMVEGAARKKTPNEIALQILLITLTIIFLVVSATLLPFSQYISTAIQPVVSPDAAVGRATSLTDIVALTICLAPTTIGALLSSIGIAGMARLNKVNVLAKTGRAIEAAGDVDILLLDKTGTITYGNRQASEFINVSQLSDSDLAKIVVISSLSDDTAEGKSILIHAAEKYQIDRSQFDSKDWAFIEFSAKTRMSGVDINETRKIRKGAADAIRKYVESLGGVYPQACELAVDKIAGTGGTPLVVCENNNVVGVIHLKDTIKSGIKEKFGELRKSGIRTVMITGDNPITAASIAQEAGVDDFIAEATPQKKIDWIMKIQKEGHLVAMTGDGTNDAPALAQADVAVAMNSGTQAAKEAGNMVDLDSSPTKLVEIVRIGKQLLMTRGALTTFSIANDLAKYFAVIPLLFIPLIPGLNVLNFLNLTSITTAILSTIIYNALIIIALIPLSLKGVRYRERSANKTLGFNLLIYGLGGVITPFIFIKIFDLILSAIIPLSMQVGVVSQIVTGS
ncbi:potassium-transporting ATPase subunit KdpB [[Mycoplasma] testudinis]|uniref:potassium-transporting ATPase subunit KdpB n=1 Tax=[Mycoplasma] testudinis TaxID=33924 RepID=UPI000A04BD02|nr:potassium-transporting ATPase subunit KdpB [[Mycoplasma] testudinis]